MQKAWSRAAVAGAAVICLAGCGQGSTAQGAGSVVRHHGQWTMTVTFKHTALGSKPLQATIHISPSTARPGTGALNMPDMHMQPVKMVWHQVKPGMYRGQAVPTMSGPWDLSVAFSHASQRWTTLFPINIQN